MKFDLTNPAKQTVRQMDEGWFQAMLDHGGPYQHISCLEWVDIDSPPYWRQSSIYRVHPNRIQKKLPDMSQNERAYVFLSDDERAALGDDARRCLHMDTDGCFSYCEVEEFWLADIYRTTSRVSGTWAVDDDGNMIPGTEVAE